MALGYRSGCGGASLSIGRNASRRDPVTILLAQGRREMAAQVDTFIAERIESKGSQMSHWGRGILVIVHGPDETAEEVAAGLDRRGECPWWRVYWTDAGGRAYLVAGDIDGRRAPAIGR
jgi:hypothetical protein